MRRLIAWSAIGVLLVFLIGAGQPVIGPDTVLAADPPAADAKASPTAPPDIVAGAAKVCAKLPADQQDGCLLGIVEKFGSLLEEKALLDTCKAIGDPMTQAVCTGVATSNPSQCDGLAGPGTELDRDLCVGYVVETMCLRLSAGFERDTCQMDLAKGYGSVFACASIGERDMRQSCYALTSGNAAYCDRITDPGKAQACRDRLAGKTTSAAASPTASLAAVDAQAGQTWSGSFKKMPGSTLTFTLTASGELSGSGIVPNALSQATAVLAVKQSSVGTSKWNGTATAKLEGGVANFDALGGALTWTDEPSWTARSDGSTLVGQMDNFGDFELSPTN